MKMKWLAILAVTVLVLAVVTVPLGLQTLSQAFARGRFIDRDHWSRIKRGMRQDEVAGILGCPPGYYTNKKLVFYDTPDVRRLDAGQRLELWTGHQGQIDVVFDKRGNVESSQFEVGAEFYVPSYVEQVMVWLRLSYPRQYVGGLPLE